MEVNIGGETRKVIFDMLTASMVADWALNSPEEMYNPIKRTMRAITFGLKRKGNNIPKDFDDETLAEWISDMEQEQYDELETFANISLGFMVATINKKAEEMMPQTEK